MSERDDAHAYLATLRRALAERPWLANGLLPDTWQAVPREMTEAMSQAVQLAVKKHWDDAEATARKAWSGALEAAPKRGRHDPARGGPLEPVSPPEPEESRS